MKIFTLNCKGNLVVAKQPLVMGILNITDDSFYDGGKYSTEKAVLLKAEQMIKDGAAIIDIGAMSSRPGSVIVNEQEELKKLTAAVSLIYRNFPEIPLSIDTFRAKVAEEAIRMGASIVNDISGGQEEPEIMEIAAKYNCPFIIMHRLGDFTTMHQKSEYNELITDIFDYFTLQIDKAVKIGIKDVIIDLGFGFSKTIDQNYTLLKNLSVFEQLNKPILAGLSRKSMLYKLLDTNPDQALNATTVVNTIALQNGAGILRVHDVKEAIECVKIFNHLQKV